jgi:hypothetical protein
MKNLAHLVFLVRTIVVAGVLTFFICIDCFGTFYFLTIDLFVSLDFLNTTTLNVFLSPSSTNDHISCC